MKTVAKMVVVTIIFVLFTVLYTPAAFAAAPTQPTAVTLTIQKDGAAVSKAAIYSQIKLTGSASGGSGTNAHYEYKFQYKAPGSSSWIDIRDFNSTNNVSFTVNESGSYSFRISARVVDSSGAGSPIITLTER